MKRLPKGLKRMSKEEFVNKTLVLKEEQAIFSSVEERIGVEWSKKNELIHSKHSIRW